MQNFLCSLSVVLLCLLSACAGEDRSDERPRLPEGVAVSVEEQGDSCNLNGVVGESHNSSLTACGFYWGNDTLSNEVDMDSASFKFSTLVGNVGSGTYYAVAYAKNGVGTTTSDTVFFNITASE